jgi:hypothetical protein
VTVTPPGASPASTPRPSALSKRALGRRPKLRVDLQGPRVITHGRRTIFRIVLSRSVRGALASVQLRRGVSHRTVTRGRVSGGRVPVALSFRNPGRHLLRVQLREAGGPPATKLMTVTVR